MANTSRALINLSKGHPTESLYAHAELARAARAAADKMDTATFSLDYGNEGASPRFAAALAALLAEEDAAAINPAAPSKIDLADRLFVTNGVSHALDVVAAVLARPGDHCLTEAATYFLAVDIFRSHGLTVGSAPPSADGSLDVDALAAQLRSGSLPSPQLLYLCPVHSNPTGNTLSAHDRAKLVALAIEFQFFIVADEVYHFLDWPSSCSENGSSRSVKPARMCTFDPAFLQKSTMKAAYDVYSSKAPMASEGDSCRGPAPKAGVGDPTGGVVVSLSSFSKILGAGLRLGWIEAAPNIISTLVTHPYVLSGGGVAPFMGAFQFNRGPSWLCTVRLYLKLDHVKLMFPCVTVEQMVCEVIESGDQRRFLDRLLCVYAAGLTALTDVLEQHRTECGWTVTSPAPGLRAEGGETREHTVGGFFVWLKLPAPLLARDVIAVAEASHGVTAMVGERCSPTGAAGVFVQDRIRLCFAFLSVDELREGGHRLAAAVLSERKRLGKWASSKAIGAQNTETKASTSSL